MWVDRDNGEWWGKYDEEWILMKICWAFLLLLKWLRLVCEGVTAVVLESFEGCFSNVCILAQIIFVKQQNKKETLGRLHLSFTVTK